MRQVGDKVKISLVGGLNYENLIDHGWIVDTKLEIVRVKDSKYPYTVKLPDNTTLDISELDIV